MTNILKYFIALFFFLSVILISSVSLATMKTYEKEVNIVDILSKNEKISEESKDAKDELIQIESSSFFRV